MAGAVKTISLKDAKKAVLASLANGDRVKDAMAAVDRSVETYRDWRKNDAAFAASATRARGVTPVGDAADLPPFDVFAEKFLRQALPEHQLRAWDVVQGMHPRNLEPCMNYQPGEEPGRFLIMNFAPNHGKSTTWTINYVTWRIIQNPNIRVLVISKTLDLAKKFVSSIKFQLTSEVYGELRTTFDPPGGWQDEKLPWREQMIYVRGRDSSEKDPTLQGLGIGSQI